MIQEYNEAQSVFTRYFLRPSAPFLLSQSVVEIQPPTPTSVRREIILHPKRHPSPPPAGGDVPKQIRMKSMPEELGEEEREATTTT